MQKMMKTARAHGRAGRRRQERSSSGNADAAQPPVIRRARRHRAAKQASGFEPWRLFRRVRWSAIRLRRAGSKKRPFFRVVVTDSRAARDSSFVEILGPLQSALQAGDRPGGPRAPWTFWLSKGAQPSDSVPYADRTSSDAGTGRRRQGSRRGRRGEMSAATGVCAVVEVLARALTDRPTRCA